MEDLFYHPVYTDLAAGCFYAKQQNSNSSSQCANNSNNLDKQGNADLSQ